MDGRGQVATFIVRVTETAGRQLIGTVERVRTGQRRRFLGVEEIGALIAAMALVTPPEGTVGSGEEGGGS